MALSKLQLDEIPSAAFSAFLDEDSCEEESDEQIDFCMLDAFTLSRLSMVSVGYWRLAGQISAQKLVLVAGSVAFLVTEIEDRAFEVDKRGQQPHFEPVD